MLRWIIVIACVWWFGRLLRAVLQRLTGGARSPRRTPGPEKQAKDYTDLTGQKISDADFEEIEEE